MNGADLGPLRAAGAVGELCPAVSMASGRLEEINAMAANFAAAFTRARVVHL